jgi:syntaxin-binding protein 5
MSFLDCNGGLVPYSYEPWKDEGKRDSKKKFIECLKPSNFTFSYLSLPTETPTKGTNRMSPTLNQDSSFGDRQFMVITSEKQCRIVALPSQNCVYSLQVTETDFVVRAEIVSMKGEF